ncbi:MAG: restriction endonuclease [bacterium]|nr:restriction endonuclease [bacterium]
MAKKYWRRRRHSNKSDPLAALFLLTVLGLGFYVFKYTEQVIGLILIILSLFIAGILVHYILKKQKQKAFLDQDDERILFALKCMTPPQFEQEMARMFSALGFRTEVVGGANDGGIDVKAYKDGKTYFVQCKKFIIRVATPHDVRDFLGAITNVKDPAEKGYLVTTNKFTLMAEKAAEGNPRIELIDGNQLTRYYKKAFGKDVPDAESKSEMISINQDKKTCPQCQGILVLKIAQKGDHAGKQFWGCSNYPNCRYLKNI